MKHLKEQPKQRLTKVWSGTQQTVVDEATDKWRWACVHTKGQHFEHLL